MATNPAPVAPVGLSAPNLTVPNLWHQFWTDAYGKEVQTAATYSYTWLADQFGHICIGIVVNYPATLVAGWVIRIMIVPAWRFIQRHLSGQEAFTGVTLPEIKFGALAGGLVITVIGAALWERSAYRSSVTIAKGSFPLDTTLLRDNAIIATFYMALGATLGFAFHLPASWWTPWVISISVVVAAILGAPFWLRQKITWQKAALPYLFRLANAVATIDPKDAKKLQKLMEGAPPAKPPRQVVIGGPIGSGRTSMAAGIGTEFAFTNHKVRYLSLDSLLEFAVSASDDLGPPTIKYWPWNEAQVVIIDDVGPLIAAREPRQKANLARFTKLLHNELKSIAGLLARCHTVWVIGDLRGPPYERGTLGATLGAFAQAIATYCSSQHEALVIELAETAKPRTPKGEPHTATVSNVRWIGPSKNP